jgi:alkylation response protein AidB-like acyl-CoA dehydrogenase
MYQPPLQDILFNLKCLIGFEKLAELKGCAEVNEELARSILEEAGKLASETFAPLNAKGDRQGLKFENGSVKTPEGFKAAYQLYVEGGWNGLCFPEEHGGQALPFTLAMPVQEMLQSGNLSLALCTLLNQGAIEAIHAQGTPAQRAKYLSKLVSGQWTGTMNLTEPQAGSDVGAVRCKAWKDGNHYRVQGQKIFISYGEHDLAENIVHLVLARLPEAPAGTKGLSLFLVPKLMVGDDGKLGEQNDVRCVSIEHKLGQHASPACTLAFGDKGGAYAEIVGGEGGGIAAMFVMMNNARIGVGVQGLGLCELSLQQSAAFAKQRVQGKGLGKSAGKDVTIINHPDVRRMLMSMKAQTEAARSLAYSAALAIDQAKHLKNADAQARIDLLTPIVKAWLTDLANEITSTSIQIHGGMGYVEETGAAQPMRDARVLGIYEGTNGIQAADLLFRKLARDEGKAFKTYLNEMKAIVDALAACKGDDAAIIAENLRSSLKELEQTAEHLLKLVKDDIHAAAFAATPFLRLFAITAGGAQMARSATEALKQLKSPEDFSVSFLESKLITARFYAESILPTTAGLLPVILAPQTGVLTLSEESF